MTFTLEQALKAQQALRKAADLPAEEFPIQAFVGMLSDEIEALHQKGKTYEEITQLINYAAQADLSTSSVRENYASPGDRKRS
jgi:hypothetical protein